MQDFTKMKNRLMELKPKILGRTATEEEAKEYDEITKKLSSRSPAKMADIWPKGEAK